jgi:hypothetical protein
VVLNVLMTKVDSSFPSLHSHKMMTYFVRWDPLFEDRGGFRATEKKGGFPKRTSKCYIEEDPTRPGSVNIVCHKVYSLCKHVVYI